MLPPHYSTGSLVRLGLIGMDRFIDSYCGYGMGLKKLCLKFSFQYTIQFGYVEKMVSR